VVLIYRQKERIKQNYFVARRVIAHNAELYTICSAVVQCTQDNTMQIVIFTEAIGQAKLAIDLSINSIKHIVSQQTDQEWRDKFLYTKYSGPAFLQLRGVDSTQLKPNLKGRLWIKLAGSNNALFACMCRCVLNHALIGSYYTCFNINSSVQCPCGCFQDRDHRAIAS
jgi:hypothetical protein